MAACAAARRAIGTRSVSYTHLGNAVGAGYGNINTQTFHHLEVLGVVDPGYGAFHTIALLCQLTGDQIHLILSGNADKGIAMFHAGAFQGFQGGAVAVDDRNIQLVGDLPADLLIGFNYKGLVAMFQQGLCQIIAYFTAAHYNNIPLD